MDTKAKPSKAKSAPKQQSTTSAATTSVLKKPSYTRRLANVIGHAPVTTRPKQVAATATTEASLEVASNVPTTTTASAVSDAAATSSAAPPPKPTASSAKGGGNQGKSRGKTSKTPPAPVNSIKNYFKPIPKDTPTTSRKRAPESSKKSSVNGHGTRSRNHVEEADEDAPSTAAVVVRSDDEHDSAEEYEDPVPTDEECDFKPIYNHQKVKLKHAYVPKRIPAMIETKMSPSARRNLNTLCRGLKGESGSKFPFAELDEFQFDLEAYMRANLYKQIAIMDEISKLMTGRPAALMDEDKIPETVERKEVLSVPSKKLSDCRVRMSCRERSSGSDGVLLAELWWSWLDEMTPKITEDWLRKFRTIMVDKCKPKYFPELLFNDPEDDSCLKEKSVERPVEVNDYETRLYDLQIIEDDEIASDCEVETAGPVYYRYQMNSEEGPEYPFEEDCGISSGTSSRPTTAATAPILTPFNSSTNANGAGRKRKPSMDATSAAAVTPLKRGRYSRDNQPPPITLTRRTSSQSFRNSLSPPVLSPQTTVFKSTPLKSPDSKNEATEQTSPQRKKPGRKARRKLFVARKRRKPKIADSVDDDPPPQLSVSGEEGIVTPKSKPDKMEPNDSFPDSESVLSISDVELPIAEEDSPIRGDISFSELRTQLEALSGEIADGTLQRKEPISEKDASKLDSTNNSLFETPPPKLECYGKVKVSPETPQKKGKGKGKAPSTPMAKKSTTTKTTTTTTKMVATQAKEKPHENARRKLKKVMYRRLKAKLLVKTAVVPKRKLMQESSEPHVATKVTFAENLPTFKRKDKPEGTRPMRIRRKPPPPPTTAKPKRKRKAKGKSAISQEKAKSAASKEEGTESVQQEASSAVSGGEKAQTEVIHEKLEKPKSSVPQEKPKPSVSQEKQKSALQQDRPKPLAPKQALSKSKLPPKGAKASVVPRPKPLPNPKAAVAAPADPPPNSNTPVVPVRRFPKIVPIAAGEPLMFAKMKNRKSLQPKKKRVPRLKGKFEFQGVVFEGKGLARLIKAGIVVQTSAGHYADDTEGDMLLPSNLIGDLNKKFDEDNLDEVSLELLQTQKQLGLAMFEFRQQSQVIYQFLAEESERREAVDCLGRIEEKLFDNIDELTPDSTNIDVLNPFQELSYFYKYLGVVPEKMEEHSIDLSALNKLSLHERPF